MNVQSNNKGDGSDLTDTLSSFTDTPLSLLDTPSSLLNINKSLTSKTNDNKEQGKRVFENQNSKKESKPRPKLKNKDPFKRGEKSYLIENQKKNSVKDTKSNSEDKTAATPKN